MVNNIEDNIFNLAIDEFNKNKEIQLEIEIEEKEKNINGFRFDKLVKFKYQKKGLFYYVEIKPNINNAVIALLLHPKLIKSLIVHPTVPKATFAISAIYLYGFFTKSALHNKV